VSPEVVKTTHLLRTPKSKYTVGKGDTPDLLLATVPLFHFYIGRIPKRNKLISFCVPLKNPLLVELCVNFEGFFAESPEPGFLTMS
jgi:hypothetical protein